MVRRGRPPKQEAKAPEKKTVTKYRVLKNRQWRDFDTQEAAREHLITCLRDGAIFFCSLQNVEVEDC